MATEAIRGQQRSGSRISGDPAFRDIGISRTREMTSAADATQKTKRLDKLPQARHFGLRVERNLTPSMSVISRVPLNQIVGRSHRKTAIIHKSTARSTRCCHSILLLATACLRLVPEALA